jgi:hypothetical protein
MSVAAPDDSGDMQLIEVTDYAVRSAALRLTRRESPLQFLIFPMVHIGEPAFYAAVTSRIRHADLIVAEGVGGPSEPEVDDPTLHWPGLELEDLPPVPPRWGALSALTASYRLAARFDRLGLVEQDIDYDTLGIPVLCPDMTGEEFAAGWRELPAWQRALMMAAGPLIGLDHLAFGSRRSLAAHLALDDNDVHDPPPGAEKLLDLIIGRRDRLLMTALEAIHEVHAGDPLTVAIVYGAYHVPAITHGLRARHGYSVRDAEWLTVFGLE